MKNLWLLTTACLAFFFCATPINERLLAAPGDAIVTPGELVVEHPTLINLGFEWRIDGDANRNATVDVSFRKAGRDSLAERDAAGAAAERATSTSRTSSTSSRRTCSPAASSISSPARRTRRASC